MSDIFTSPQVNADTEARISPSGEQLVLGVCHYDLPKQASQDRNGSSVGKRWPILMGRYPFMTVANRLLRDTAGFYAESTQAERERKFRRIQKILVGLLKAKKISTVNPVCMSEKEVCEFVIWCKERLDASTASKYIRFLGEVLQYVGNQSVEKVKIAKRGLLPIATPKSIQTISSENLDHLLSGLWALENDWWDAVGKSALTLYAHSGMRPSELRTAKLKDLDLSRLEIVVSNPKGKRRWSSGEEKAPIIGAAEACMREYLERRTEALREIGLDARTVEPLFPYIAEDGQVDYWNERVWQRLKVRIEQASGVRFKWKYLRPTFAQKAKDLGAPIEAVSKCLRHTSTRTTELYYARIRSDTAFSQVRQAWEAPTVKIL
jgi:integrase